MPNIAKAWCAALGNSNVVAPERFKIIKKRLTVYQIGNLEFVSGKVALHIFMQAIQVWKDAYDGKELEFKRRHFTPETTANQVMASVPLLRSMTQWEREEFAITQVIETGTGKWTKGTTVQYGSENGESTLAQLFWNAADIDPNLLPPFWLCIHKCTS